jgi:hypothetical protein
MLKTFAGRVGGFVGLIARFEASERQIDPRMLLDIQEVSGKSVLDSFDKNAPCRQLRAEFVA